jgi:hypothetical protein
MSHIRPTRERIEQIDAATRERAQGHSDVQLLDHQLLPLDYMLKNPDIKGLLVNHYMGTGKTILGIGFAESYPDHPVIILAPGFLESTWRNELARFGVRDLTRYTFVSYDDAPHKLGDLDLKKHIILADEAHNLIRKMRSLDQESNARYTQIYMSLRKAYKILGLTGTPIYSDESDLAFLINLVSGQTLMPFNQEAFRLKYTKIRGARQFFRGYLTESNLIASSSAYALGQFFSGLVMAPWGVWIGLPISVLVPVLINLTLPPSTYKLRELDAEKMLPVINKYISYFRYPESQFADFPALDLKVREVSYNQEQYSFFLRLVEGDLGVELLQRLLKNEKIIKSDEFVEINSTSIQEQIYSVPGFGRDIGNFEFMRSDGSLIEPPKFVKIYEEQSQNPVKTMVYSNYYETGTLAYAEFLKRQDSKIPFAIIEPTMPEAEMNKIVAAYNKGDIKLVLLHPDIKEGISFLEVERVDFLEPPINPTITDQVIGRARRFRSHSNLPKERQKVSVNIWQSSSSIWDAKMRGIKRANWYKRYRELAYMSQWGLGVAQVDKKYDRKALNPEELAMLKLRTLERNLFALQKLLTTESIENIYKP